MDSRTSTGWVVASMLAILAGNASADGTESLDVPTIPIAGGTSVIAAGVGLFDVQPRSLQIDVPPGATVNQVLLYVEGSNYRYEDYTPTMSVTVNGIPVTTTSIGGNTDYGLGRVWTASYRADITALGLIGPGSNLISLGGLDFTRDNDGAGLFVIIDDGGPRAAIDVRDGSDVAYVQRPAPLDETVPQTFSFPAAPVDRLGAVDLFVGSCAGSRGYIGDYRPNSFEVTTGGTTAVFSDQLNSNDGHLWDTVRLGVSIPAGATSLTVQVFSRDDGIVAPGNDPASLVWLAAAFSVETVTNDCWITTGGFQNAGTPKGSKLYTFGGNVGPPPRGSWQVIDHTTGDNFHSNDVHITACTTVGNGGPGQPGGKKGLKTDRADFAGVGRLNFVDGYPFVGYVEDAGEPHGKKGKNQDVFSITVFDPVTGAVVFQASAPLDGGNVQIHPPVGPGKPQAK